MGEIAERLSNVLARTAGNTVSPAVTALMQAAAIATGNVDLAMWATPAGALAGSLTEEGVYLVRSSWSDRSDRVQQFAEEAESLSDQSIDELLALAAQSSAARRLLGVAVEDATESHDTWKIKMLANAFVCGARDPARVDELVYLVKALKGLDGPDVRMLAACHRWEKAGAKGYVGGWVKKNDPAIYGVLEILRATLFTSGLIHEDSRPSGSGRFCVDALKTLGGTPEDSS